ncbi:rad2 superfamily protein mus201 [Halictus rubicundus]|uniref:rad2 superfamily protein mus201 n=1 Tax=Halictus rubicundus TaxID=77578 RepID=UPI0040356451
MGVHGLWRLLDATGKQVPLETLEGKVLAIDISIWIHQVLQGYQDRFGNPKPNAHLIGLFNRICKLLYYKIKPVFVFDGGVPMLKKDTIALRRKQKSVAKNKALQMRTELINNLIKHSAVKTVLNTEDENVKNISTQMILSSQNKQTTDDMFILPEMPSTNPPELSLSDDYDSDSSTIELSPRKQTKWIGNIHSVDVGSTEFKALPADVRYEILTDLKETRKQNSWGRLHEMPDESHEFSGYQLKRLLKRRLVQQSLESAEKEMGGKSLTLEELEKLLTEQGVDTTNRDCTYRIAADSTTRLFYISDKNAYIKNISNNSNPNDQEVVTDKDEAEEPVPGTSKDVPISENMNEYELDDEWDSDVEITATTRSKSPVEESSNDSYFTTAWKESQPPSKKYFGKHTINPALSYMLEYSGLTEGQICTLLEQRSKEGGKGSQNTVKTSLQFDLLRTKSGNSKDNEDSEDFTEVGTTEAIEPLSTSEVGFSESNVQSDDNLSSVTISKASKIESDVVTVISSTDSDSDFIEIADVPTVDFGGSEIKKSTSQQAIEITLRSDQTIEDDMFADVFGAPNTESKIDEVEATSENVSISSELFEIVEQTSPDRSEMLETAVLEETIVKTIEEKVKDQSPTTKTDDIETLKVTDNDTDNNNVKNVDTQLENIEEIDSTDNANDSSQKNAEIISMEDNANTSTSITDLSNVSPLPVNEDELLSLKARLEDEQSELMTNIGKLQRQGVDISKQVSSEAQELLRLFGIPYVVAPMEAEAQCAYLEQIRLTDGTITDDSDIWLFGGQCVYKNFFDSTKKVLRYRSCDIQHHFKLTRNELIRLALLVGSDYTTGLAGIGPVTALEILAAFPSEGDNLLQGLTSFCSWVTTGRAAGPGKAGLRNKLQNLQIQKGFPSQAVVQAYLVPKVDESKEAFTWGKPNTLLLSNYAKQKFGWTKEKFNEIMTPILKRLEEKQDQKFIDTYFRLQSAVPKSIDVNLSKRVQKAVQRLNNPNMEDATEDVESVRSKEITRQPLRKKRTISSTEARKKKKESVDTRETTDLKAAESEVFNASVDNKKSLKDYIPQREKDKAEALKKKLHAIEVVRRSKQGLYKTKKVKRCVRKVKEEAGLSESDSSSS